MFHHRNGFSKVLAAAALSGLSLALNACSGVGSLGSGSSSNGALSSAPTLVANRAMKDAEEVYASPLDGGLYGNLYIQPRATMLVQDNGPTVGCGQNGSGALGLEAYLNQPSWVTQQVLFTELFVPTRNFNLGFPAPAGHGSILAVNSYFTLDVQGFFHLAPGESEGDYQFALIADDAAQLKIGEAGAYTMLVDDQKPASYDNGTCLKQTQSAHMSCTTKWGDNSSAKVRTVHIKPNQLVPIEMLYWQGPGGGISMMAFYRKTNPANPASLQDSACGQENGFGQGEASLNNVLSTWTPIGFSNLSGLAL